MRLLKMMFHILFAPVELVLRLMIGLLAFVVSISTSLLSIAASFFVFMAVLMFITNSIQNGLIYLLLAFLISPIGLPALADHLLNGLDFVLTKISDIAC